MAMDGMDIVDEVDTLSRHHAITSSPHEETSLAHGLDLRPQDLQTPRVPLLSQPRRIVRRAHDCLPYSIQRPHESHAEGVDPGAAGFVIHHNLVQQEMFDLR